MSKIIQHVKDITGSRGNHELKVRVIRLFKVPKKDDPTQYGTTELILMDEQGDKIHAVIKEAFMVSLSLLKEGGAYLISNFGVALYDIPFKFSDHKYKVIFYRNTTVKICSTISVPIHGFNFTAFEKILDESQDKGFLYDVIGQLVGIGDQIVTFTKSNGKDGKRINLQLMDASNNIINCTLWDDFAELCRPFIGASNQNTVVVIVQFAKLGKWNNAPNVSNGYYGTMVYFDDESISEIANFKERISKNSASKGGNSCVQLSSERSYSSADIFLDLSARKTLDELYEHLHERGTVLQAIVLATIDHIEDSFGWYYNSCKKCKSKVQKQEDQFWCKKCDALVKYAIPRFCIQVNVIDGSGTAQLTIFDREATHFLKKSVTSIIESIDKDEDISIIPDDLNVLLNKKMLFRVLISQFNISRLPSVTAYTVINMTADLTLIEKFEQYSLESEENQPSLDADADEVSKVSSNEMETPRKREYININDEEENSKSDEESYITKHVKGSTTKKRVTLMKVKTEKLE